MLTLRVPSFRRAALLVLPLLVAIMILMSLPVTALAQSTHTSGEAELTMPDLSQATFGGINGRTLLMYGLAVCALGLLFGLLTYSQLKNLPVHRSMLEISELIYETCKTYLITQGKFLLVLEVFIGAVMVLYFGVLRHMDAVKVVHHPVVQPGGDRGQLRSGVVRHSSEHVRQFAHRFRQLDGQSLSPVTPSL